MERPQSAMKSRLLWLIVAAALVTCFVLYRSRLSRLDLNVDPHAREEIEKAMRH
jgi:hypothetical protein